MLFCHHLDSFLSFPAIGYDTFWVSQVFCFSSENCIHAVTKQAISHKVLFNNIFSIHPHNPSSVKTLLGLINKLISTTNNHIININQITNHLHQHIHYKFLLSRHYLYFSFVLNLALSHINYYYSPT